MRPGDQSEAIDQRGGDEYVLPAGRKGPCGVAKEAAATIEHLKDSGDSGGFG